MSTFTPRELTLCKSILDYLHSLDNGQAIEIEIHAAILRDPAVHPKPSASEVESAIKICDAKKWTTGVPGKFVCRMKWNINDAGEAARLEM